MSFYPFGGTTYTLRSSISSTATTIPLSSFLEPVSGVPYTMALLNTDIAYATIQPKTISSEFISFTGITQNTDGTADLTGVTRGLQKKYPFTSSPTFQLPHSGQSQFIISDAPQLFKKYGALENDEVITGQWEAPDPTTAQGIVTRDYMLALINGGPISVEAIVVQGLAGEVVDEGNILYLRQGDGLWYKADSVTINTGINLQLGIAKGHGDINSLIDNGIILEGVDTKNTGTAGAYGYVSDTPGSISGTPGTNPYIIGQFLPSSGGFYFNPTVYTRLTFNQQQAMAGSVLFGTPSATNKFITSTNLLSRSLGDGSDGDVTISSPTTLTRDMYYNNLTINSTLTTDGYRIFVKGTISGSGTVKWGTPTAGGNGGSSSSSAAAGTGGASAGSGSFKNVPGSNGGAGSSSGTNGVAGTTKNIVVVGNGSAGGNGGTGGGTQRTGGSAGTGTKIKPQLGTLFDNALMVIGLNDDGTTGIGVAAAGGGGGGSSSGSAGTGSPIYGGGGGAGASGGVVVIACNTFSGTFTIDVSAANGGNGGSTSGSTGSISVSGAGGGAGGAGGAVLVFYNSKSWAGSYVLNGGNGGTGSAGYLLGTSGTNGTNGPTGLAVEFVGTVKQ